MMDRKIILASQSPRRKELISKIIPDFEIMVDTSEEKTKGGLTPEETVRFLARQKAENIAKKVSDSALIIGADTVVSIDDMIFGKPTDEEDAKRMLRTLSGRQNTVCTGIAIIDTSSGKIACDSVTTNVVFKELTDDEILNYISTGEPMDKAGAYGIQDLGSILVEEIHGDCFNVIGLPLCRLAQMLKTEFDYKIL